MSNQSKLIACEIIHKGSVITLNKERVILPNQAVSDLDIVHHPGGAAVVAVNQENKVCLLKQYRHAVQDWLWEIPAGKLEADETPFVTASRELKEEAGCIAEHWQDLGITFPSPGVLTERIYLYLATDIGVTGPCHEAHEVIEVHWVKFEEAKCWAQQGKIVDAKTIVAICRAEEELFKRAQQKSHE